MGAALSQHHHDDQAGGEVTGKKVRWAGRRGESLISALLLRVGSLEAIINAKCSGFTWKRTEISQIKFRNAEI